MSAVLDVRPAGFAEAAPLLGADVVDGLASTWSALLFGLAPVQGMAGTDDVGAAWGASYDSAARVACRATAELACAVRHVAGLVQQTALNYAGAEHWSTGGSAAEQDRNPWVGDAAVKLVPVPTAVGTAMPAPHGWSVVAHAVGRLWPDGHQDDLHTAARAWRAAAGQVDGLGPVVGSAARLMLCQTSPEAGDAFVVIDALIDHLQTVARGYRHVAAACEAYAAHLDAAHTAILAELKSFLEWTAGIEATSALFSVITLGASEVVGQAGEGVEIARTAKAIAKVIDVLRTAAAAVRAEIARVGTELAALPERLAPLLRIEVAEARFTPVLRVEMAGNAELRLANPDLIPPVTPTPAAEALANLEQADTEIAELTIEIRDPKQFDPQSLRGMTEDEVKGLIPEDWRERPATSGDGVVFEDATNRGRQIRVMQGYDPATRAEPITHGPYAVVSQNGTMAKIPLAGNPAL